MSVRQRFDLAVTPTVAVTSGGIDLFVQHLDPVGRWMPVGSFVGPVELTASAIPDGYSGLSRWPGCRGSHGPDCVGGDGGHHVDHR